MEPQPTVHGRHKWRACVCVSKLRCIKLQMMHEREYVMILIMINGHTMALLNQESVSNGWKDVKGWENFTKMAAVIALSLAFKVFSETSLEISGEKQERWFFFMSVLCESSFKKKNCKGI